MGRICVPSTRAAQVARPIAAVQYDAQMPDPSQLRTLQSSAERLGELLAKAADRKGKVPEALWRAIAEAAVQVAAAAEMLAEDSKDGAG